MKKTIDQPVRRLSFLLSSFLVVLSLLLSAAPVAAEPVPQATTNLLQSCNTVAEETLQAELNIISQQVYGDALGQLDLDAIVARQWLTLDIAAALNDAVDLAVDRVKSETDLWNTFLSSWSPDMSRELALTVSTYTFADPTFRAKLDELSAALALEVGESLSLASTDTVSAALYCLQTFIRHNYSRALVHAFETRVQTATASTALLDVDAIGPDILAMLGEHQVALGGVGVIIAAQITRKIVVSVAQRISQRVAGRIVGRVLGRAGSTVIPVAGWIIGTGMIVYDLYESRDGALPQIQASLKSPLVQEGIRSEIVASVAPELAAEVPVLARRIANDLYAEWRTTKRTIRTVLDLAGMDREFAGLVDSLESEEQLARLVAAVDLLTERGDQDSVQNAVAGGTLARFVELPMGGETIAVATGSLEEALAWYDLVGDRVDEIAALEIYKHQQPETVDMTVLDRLLALEDRTAVARLSLLPPSAAAALLELSTANLVTLANQLSPAQLAWLGEVGVNLSAEQRDQLTARLLSEPALAAALMEIDGIEHLLADADLEDAISFVTGPRDAGTYWLDAVAVARGAATPALFLAKHGVWPSVGAVAGLLLLLLVALRLAYGFGHWLAEPLRLFRPRR